MEHGRRPARPEIDTNILMEKFLEENPLGVSACPCAHLLGTKHPTKPFCTHPHHHVLSPNINPFTYITHSVPTHTTRPQGDGPAKSGSLPSRQQTKARVQTEFAEIGAGFEEQGAHHHYHHTITTFITITIITCITISIITIITTLPSTQPASPPSPSSPP